MSYNAGGPVTSSMNFRVPWSEIVAEPAAVAKHAGVTERTVRRWVEDGTLINYGTQRRILVSVAELSTAKTRRAIRRSGLVDTMSATV